MIKISIIIPVKNGKKTLVACLDAIYRQSLIDITEVIIIDSGSIDESLEIIGKYPVRLYQIKPEEFNHGETRNLGAKLAKGEFLFFTVQDAWADDENLLRRMLSHFDDKNVVGVCGQQKVPHEKDKNPLEWFRPFSEPMPRRYQFKDRDQFLGLSPEKKSEAAGWDNVIAMYRTDFLLLNPFEITNFSEDIRWARKALESGKTLVIDYRNRVNHYHHENPIYRYKRRYIESFHQFYVFGIVPRPFSNVYLMTKRLLYEIVKRSLPLKWQIYNIKLILASFVLDVEFVLIYKIAGETGLISRYKKLAKEIPQGIQNGK